MDTFAAWTAAAWHAGGRAAQRETKGKEEVEAAALGSLGYKGGTQTSSHCCYAVKAGNPVPTQQKGSGYLTTTTAPPCPEPGP